MPGEGGSEYVPWRVSPALGHSPVLQHYKKSRFDTGVGQVPGTPRRHAVSEHGHRPVAINCVIIGRRRHPAGRIAPLPAEVCFGADHSTSVLQPSLPGDDQ
jgi:hypothetical protein